METIVCCLIVGCIAFIAGRALVGSRSVTLAHAEAVAQQMYEKGLREGRTASATGNHSDVPPGMMRAGNAQAIACEEYTRGFYNGMDAVRAFGDEADSRSAEHLAGVMQCQIRALATL